MLKSKDISIGRDEQRVLTPLSTLESEREEIGNMIIIA